MPAMNEDPEAYWNEQAGPRWVRAQAAVDRAMAPLTAHLLESAAPGPGERVLDVGCGCGSTLLALAAQVGAQGHVLGVDISQPMLEEAERRTLHTAQVELRLADAGKFDFAAVEPFDLICSRFGTMFFPEPPAAFSNLRRALKPSGRMVFMCWQSLERNPWIAFLMGAFPEHEPQLPGPDDGPGPFSLSNPDTLASLLDRAGYADVRVQGFRAKLVVGETPSQVLEGASEVGPFARVLSEADPSERPALMRRATAFLEARFREGTPELGSAVWVVSARPGTGSAALDVGP